LKPFKPSSCAGHAERVFCEHVNSVAARWPRVGTGESFSATTCGLVAQVLKLPSRGCQQQRERHALPKSAARAGGIPCAPAGEEPKATVSSDHLSSPATYRCCASTSDVMDWTIKLREFALAPASCRSAAAVTLRHLVSIRCRRKIRRGIQTTTAQRTLRGRDPSDAHFYFGFRERSIDCPNGFSRRYHRSIGYKSPIFSYRFLCGQIAVRPTNPLGPSRHHEVGHLQP
jgi:hypothetical protein